MATFLVEVHETASRVVEVDADDMNDALDKVNTMYREEEIVLDAGDFNDYEINVIEQVREGK